MRVGATIGGTLSATVIAAIGIAAPAGAEICPNEQLRRENGSLALPECRAYEQVSPTEKNGSDVLGYVEGDHAALDGEAVEFSSLAAFGNAAGSYSLVQYLSKRGPAGWSTEGLLPPQNNPPLDITPPKVKALSRDLTFTAIQASDPPAVPGIPAGQTYMYARNNATGAFTVFSPVGSHSNDYSFADATPDFSHVLFESSADLIPSTPGPAAPGPKLYEYTEGHLRRADVLPDGSLPSEGGVAGNAATNPAPEARLSYTQDENVMSEDGRYVFWTDVATKQLYMRVDGTTTVRISAPQRPVEGPDPEGPYPAVFRKATPSGSMVFFTSEEKLTEGSTAEYGRPNLYRYDTRSGELEDLSGEAAPEAQAAEGVAGVSDDGSYVYYGNGFGPGGQLYVWHDGTVRVVPGAGNSNNFSFLGVFPAGRALSRVSTDGKRLLFVTDELGGVPEAGDFSLYDADTGTAECVTCLDGAETGTAGIETQTPGGVLIPQSSPFFPTVMSADGDEVFFQSSSALVRGAVNGRSNIYEWKDGRRYLISSGQSAQDSDLVGVSADGRDVFFTTYDRLVPADKDNNSDMYDARVDGGYPAQPTPLTCTGETCQGSTSTPPALPSVGSASLSETAQPAAISPPSPIALKASAVVGRRVQDARLSVTVKVPAAGHLTLSSADARTLRRAVTRAATYHLAIVLSAKARTTLKRKHRLRLKLRIAYAPQSGAGSATSVTVTVKA